MLLAPNIWLQMRWRPWTMRSSRFQQNWHGTTMTISWALCPWGMKIWMYAGCMLVFSGRFLYGWKRDQLRLYLQAMRPRHMGRPSKRLGGICKMNWTNKPIGWSEEARLAIGDHSESKGWGKSSFDYHDGLNNWEDEDYLWGPSELRNPLDMWVRGRS